MKKMQPLGANRDMYSKRAVYYMRASHFAATGPIVHDNARVSVWP